jgi:membrane protease YdiL (CAAX protease family)
MNAKSATTPRNSRTTTPGSSTTADPVPVDGYASVKQYSKAQVLAAWAATTVPMGLLAWLATPWLSHRLSGPDPFISALLLCFLVGLIWQLALVMLLVRHEQGSLRRSRVCAALWLRRPTNPRTGRTGGKVWWWTVPFVLLSAAVNAGWLDPAGPIPRDLPTTLEREHARLEHFFHGNWGAFGLLVAVAFLAPIVEELFFRGLLLPRMRTAFGKADVVVNGTIFGLYHLHQPWSIPASIIDGIINQAYPSKRFQSIWIAIIAHTAPSFVIIGAVVPLVL